MLTGAIGRSIEMVWPLGSGLPLACTLCPTSLSTGNRLHCPRCRNRYQGAEAREAARSSGVVSSPTRTRSGFVPDVSVQSSAPFTRHPTALTRAFAGAGFGPSAPTSRMSRVFAAVSSTDLFGYPLACNK